MAVYRTPTVLQMEVVECGAASLAMILGYYKKFLSLEELRITCGVSRDGVSAFNVVAAGKSYGLDSKGARLSVEDLQLLKGPCILFWDFNHFVVFEGFSKKGAHLNDPAQGRRTLSLDEFSKHYTGVTLTFEKTDAFKPGGSPPSAIGALKGRFKYSQPAFIYLSVAQLCLLIPPLASAALAQIFIDKILADHYFTWIWGVVIALLTALILNGLLLWFRGKCLYRLNAFLSISMSSKFLKHLMQLPTDYYDQRSSGDLAWRVQLNDTVINNITEKLAGALLNALQIAVYAVVLFSFSWIIALVGILEIVFNIALLLFINRTRQEMMAKVIQNQLQMIGFSVTGIAYMETIKSLGMESDFFSKWANFNTRWLLSQQSFGKRNIVLATLVPFFRSITNALVLGIGAYLILQGKLTIGMWTALHIIMGYFLAPIQELISLGETIQTTKINLLRLDDTTKNKKDHLFTSQKEATESPVKLKGYFEMKDVDFGYTPTKPPVVQNINLSIAPGKSVAIVGGTGSGKSTITALAMNLYWPSKGEILYDNQKREEICPLSFCNSVSIVNQRIFLFSGSIRDNITLWNRSIPDELLITAAKDALIHEEVIKREGGYDHEIMEKGADLSGGERQRLEIARALVKNPTFLILDEATSALDAVTESLIIRNIKRRGCACLVIAHRLSAIRDCDEIIVLDQGKVVQRGTHESLKGVDGYYKELVEKEMLQ